MVVAVAVARDTVRVEELREYSDSAASVQIAAVVQVEFAVDSAVMAADSVERSPVRD